jgi:glycerol-3-phosphate dehydrogenase
VSDPSRIRANALERLQKHEFDLLVLGGGVTGAGIARDAALRGLSVALVEKADLANGTSSASSKLIHGGLRYLEQGELALVFEGTRERWLLRKNAPHLARPLPFLFPLYRGQRVGPLMLAAGMWVYDLLAMFRNYRRHRMLSRVRTMRAEPMLQGKGLRAAALYYDCRTDDARLTLETALDAEAHGAVIATYAEAVGLTTDSIGNTTGLLVRDGLDPAGVAGEGEPSEPFPVRARVTVVAAGPWTDEILQERGHAPMLRPTKGSHIVLDAARLPLEHAIVLTGRKDGRVMFAIPWGKRTIVGTTDTDENEGPDRLEASAADVAYLLEAANDYFPTLNATPADVISTWSGLRPLMGGKPGETASDVSREHAILNLDPGLLAIVGGKLTTYRLMAEQVVDRTLAKLGVRAKVEPCRTKETPLLGASDPEALADVEAYAAGLAQEYALDAEVALHLTRSYGLRARKVLESGKEAGVRPGRLVPDLPFLVDEVVFAARFERAERLDDVLRRRTLLFLQDKDQGLGVAQEAAEVMAQVKGWDQARVDLELDRYRRMVAASRGFRAPTRRRTVPKTSKHRVMAPDAASQESAGKE